jgi:hypothetical protein
VRFQTETHTCKAIDRFPSETIPASILSSSPPTARAIRPKRCQSSRHWAIFDTVSVADQAYEGPASTVALKAARTGRHDNMFPRQPRPGFANIWCRPNEGAGKAGRRSHPWGPCNRKHGGRTTGSTGNTPAFPAQWFYGLYALPGVPGFVAPVIRKYPCELDLSVGRPGPRGFAIRTGLARPAKPARPSHPASYVRDDRDTPLQWKRDATP